MKFLCCFNDLSPLGIIPLTGEACGLGYRLLCDVTVQGARAIDKCLGVKVSFADPWNRGTGNDPHIGSIMLAHEMLLPLGVFAMLESGCKEVWSKGGFLLGIDATDSPEEVARLWQLHGPLRQLSYRGTVGDRNVHAMSGRGQ